MKSSLCLGLLLAGLVALVCVMAPRHNTSPVVRAQAHTGCKCGDSCECGEGADCGCLKVAVTGSMSCCD